MVISPGGGTPQSGAARPFFTLRSLVAFFLAALVAIPVSTALGHQQGTAGAASAVIYALGVVCFVLTWAGGLVFAWRGRSLFWFFVVCFLGPLGSLICAWFVTAASRGPRGGARP